jgi:hypothetical protein
MLITPTGSIEIVAAASQPASSVQGHPLNEMLDGKPFLFPFAQQVWAMPNGIGAVDVIVTI